MRRVPAAAILTASVALGALAPAASAVEKTINVPILHCQVYVQTYDASLSFNWNRVTFEKSGASRVDQNCVSPF